MHGVQRLLCNMVSSGVGSARGRVGKAVHPTRGLEAGLGHSVFCHRFAVCL